MEVAGRFFTLKMFFILEESKSQGHLFSPVKTHPCLTLISYFCSVSPDESQCLNNSCLQRGQWQVTAQHHAPSFGNIYIPSGLRDPLGPFLISDP